MPYPGPSPAFQAERYHALLRQLQDALRETAEGIDAHARVADTAQWQELCDIREQIDLAQDKVASALAGYLDEEEAPPDPRTWLHEVRKLRARYPKPSRPAPALDAPSAEALPASTTSLSPSPPAPEGEEREPVSPILEVPALARVSESATGGELIVLPWNAQAVSRQINALLDRLRRLCLSRPEVVSHLQNLADALEVAPTPEEEP